MEDIDSIKGNPAVVHFYEERVRLKKRGRELEGLCPFHNERTPSFQVFQKDGTLMFHCKGCGETGNVIQFVERIDKITFSEALSKVKEYLQPTWHGKRESVESVFRTVGTEHKKDFAVFSLAQYQKLESALANSEAGKDWLLKQRGIGYETAKNLHFGYVQDLSKVTGSSNPLAREGWIAFPNIQDDKVICIKYRSIKAKFVPKPDGDKWSGLVRQPNMQTSLHGLESIDMLEPVYVVEGELDRAAIEQAGSRAVSVPNSTTEITPAMKDQLLASECVILAGDTDGPGAKLMEKLWVEMERTYLLRWPSGIKDANQYLIDACKKNMSVFRTKLGELTAEARSRPMHGIYSLPEMMLNNAEENLADHPLRFRFPWSSVDQMAILAPGSVIGVVATNTGMGKSTWAIQATLHAARRHQETILNYQAELSQEQISRMVTAHLLGKHRLELTKDDFARASAELSGIKYYIGRDPNLNTIEPVLDLIEAGIKRLSPTTVVLDNLHFLCRYEADQVKAVENAMQRIKNMAALYKLKFFVIGQPKKADSKSKGKTIHITDVRGSASFGDDSDAVFTIHRDVIGDWSESKKNEYDTLTKIRLVKVRDKGPGDAEVDLLFLGEIATFREVSYQAEPQSGLEFGK